MFSACIYKDLFLFLKCLGVQLLQVYYYRDITAFKQLSDFFLKLGVHGCGPYGGAKNERHRTTDRSSFRHERREATQLFHPESKLFLSNIYYFD